MTAKVTKTGVEMQLWGFGAGNRRRRLGAGALIMFLLASVAAVLAVGANAGTSPLRLASVQRAPAAPIGATALGAPAASASQTGFVVLKPRDESALKSFIAAVSKPHSKQYRQYLKAGQFAARFGPTSSTIAAVRAQLGADGLSVTSVARDGLLIGFSGTTARVESAFNTGLERYKSAAGITGEQTTKAISLPSNISSDVAAVVGLNTLVHPEAGLTRAPRSAYAGRQAATTASFTHYTGAPSACSDASSAASLFGGLTDDQIANAYGATALYGAGDTGAGVNIGVYELEPYSNSDLQTFDQCYFGTTQGDAMAAGVNTVKVDGGQPNGSGSGEAILDIEDVSAMAPGAHIDVYEAPNTTAGSLDEYARMVNDDTDQIITSSWGLCEQDMQIADPGGQQAENYIFQQAAAQGQTVLSAAGDTGNDTCNEVRSVPPPTDQNPLSVEDPASQPYVLAVGGTTIQDADPAHYNETVWNDGAAWGGGGGGLSMSWEAPSWQQSSAYYSGSGYSTDLGNANSLENNAASLGISSQAWPPGFCANNSAAGFSASTPCRGVPDVSAQADEFTGAVTIYSAMFVPPGAPASEGWITIGGTSSATPIWAAMLALVDSSGACPAPVAGKAPGIGFANPLLYAVAAAGTSEYNDSFHDITVGNNDDFGFDQGLSFPARTGYDLASGLGSPILAHSDGTPGLAANLCALTVAGATPTITGLSPAVGTKAGGTSVTVTGTGFESGGTSDVSSVTIGSDVIKLPSAAVTVNSSTQMTVTMPAGSTSLAPGTDTNNLDPVTGTTYTTGGSYTGQDGAGLANVVVTLTSGVSSRVYANDPSVSPNVDQYTYVDVASGTSNNMPSVSSVSPYGGSQAGGNTVTLYGSGFASTDTVKVGGVAATSVTYISPTELRIVAPAYNSTSTSCTTQTALLTELSALGNTTDTNPAADNICQTEVVVTDPSTSESSNAPAPLPTYLGLLPSTTQDGLLEVPSGNELAPVPDEYDYVPAPTITGVTAVSTTDGLANADPGSYGAATILAIHGTGLNYQTLNWLSFGDPSQAANQDIYYPAYADGTNLAVAAPADPTAPSSGSDPNYVPVSAATMGGQSTTDPACTISSPDCLTYAGLPEIDSVTAEPSGIDATPDTGGTSLVIGGLGLSDVTGPLQFVDDIVYPPNPPFSIGTQYTYTKSGDTVIDTKTVSQNPAIVDTYACSDSGCSAQTANDQLLLYPPGNPVITSIQDASGPQFGGTLVTINGENLGCVTGINFGSTSAMVASKAAALLDCGSTTQVQVVAPPGTAGASVPITLSTVESLLTHAADATSLDATSGPTEFTYDSVNPSLSSVPFGSLDLGSTSSETVTLTNPSAATQPLYPEPQAPNAAGTGTVTVPATIGGADPGDFTITSDGCAGQTLAPGQSCAFQVQFKPSALGSRTAALDVPFNYSASVAGAYGFPQQQAQTPDLQASLTGSGTEPTSTVTNTVTTPGTTTTRTVTKTKRVTCTITIRWRWVTVKVHGKKRRKHKKFVTRSKGCKKTRPLYRAGARIRVAGA